MRTPSSCWTKWKSHFVILEAFLKIGCGAEIKGSVFARQFNLHRCVPSVFSCSLSYSTTIFFLLWIWWRKMQGSGISSVAFRSRKRDSGKSTFAPLRSRFESPFKGKPRPKSLVSGLERRLRGYLSSSTSSMAMKGLPWETNYCPRLTVFDSKKVKKFLRSQVAWTIKFEKKRTTAPSCSPTRRP